MATLQTLRNRIARDIRRVGDPIITDTLGGMIDEKINVSKKRMCLDNNYKAMEEIARVALATNTPSYPQPDRFKGLVPSGEAGSVKVVDTSKTPAATVVALQKYNKPDFDRLVIITDPTPRSFNVLEIDDSLEGVPLAYSIFREEFFLFPITDNSTVLTDRSLEISFYQIPEDYNSNSDEDFYLTFGENALYYGALAELMPVLRQDHRVEFFTIKFESDARQLASVNTEIDLSGETAHIRG
jgi:hypothetical protein